MLHLFGRGLGQKGSTRYRGAAAPRCWAWIRADAAIAQTAALVRTTRAALIWIFMWTVIHEPGVRAVRENAQPPSCPLPRTPPYEFAEIRPVSIGFELANP